MADSQSACPVLMNTQAGAIHEFSGPEQLQRMAGEAGFELDIRQTHSVEEMQEQLRQLVQEGAPRVAVAGGDGTVEIAVQIVAHTNTALGILSQGTFNNFASALRLPHNLPAALGVLHTGRICAVDLGCVNGRYFTESAGIGLFADGLSLYGEGTNKNFLRGLYTLARLALAFRPCEAEIVVDGEPHQARVTLCEVTNTYRIAQAVPIAPEADVDDGYLDVVLLQDIERHELLEYLKALRAQMHLGLPKVKVLRARREVRIATHRRRRNVHADDTVVGVTPVQITVEAGALKVLVPDKP